MHSLRWLKVFRLQASLPDLVHNLLVVHLFKYAVTSNDYKVIVVLDLEGTNLRSGDHYIWVAAVSLVFSLNVSDCAGDGESTGEDSMWSDESLSTGWITWGRVRYVWLVLVHFASITLNSFRLRLIFRLMVNRERHNLSPWINWHKRATITDIRYVAYFTDY